MSSTAVELPVTGVPAAGAYVTVGSSSPAGGVMEATVTPLTLCIASGGSMAQYTVCSPY